jgi:nucleoid-associated protein YgaU
MGLKNNIYSKRLIVKYTEGDYSIQRIIPNYPTSTEDEIHTVIQDDTLTQIAFKYYGEPVLWYHIADVNNIFNPFDLVVGSSLRIPNLEILDYREELK